MFKHLVWITNRVAVLVCVNLNYEYIYTTNEKLSQCTKKVIIAEKTNFGALNCACLSRYWNGNLKQFDIILIIERLDEFRMY